MKRPLPRRANRKERRIAAARRRGRRRRQDDGNDRVVHAHAVVAVVARARETVVAQNRTIARDPRPRRPARTRTQRGVAAIVLRADQVVERRSRRRHRRIVGGRREPFGILALARRHRGEIRRRRRTQCVVAHRRNGASQRGRRRPRDRALVGGEFQIQRFARRAPDLGIAVTAVGRLRKPIGVGVDQSVRRTRGCEQSREHRGDRHPILGT